jgi:hypothetical protein
VVNPVNGFLVEYAAYYFIQRLRRFKVASERLFQNDSRPSTVAPVQSHRAQTFHDGSRH